MSSEAHTPHPSPRGSDISRSESELSMLAFAGTSSSQIELRRVDSMDFYHTGSESRDIEYPLTSGRGILKHILSIFTDEKPLALLFVVVLGLLSACASLGVDFAILWWEEARKMVHDSLPFPLNFLALVCLATLFAALTALTVQFLAEHRAGSGIPEMKCILAGLNIKHFLSLRTGFAKWIGLIFATGTGLPVGRTSPMVQAIAALCQGVFSIPWFKTIRRNDFLRLQFLATSVGCACAAVLGAPIGGVVFAMEVTSTFYLVSNLWKGLSAAMLASVFFFVMSVYMEGEESVCLYPTSFHRHPFGSDELLAFGVLGILGGALGAVFVSLTRMLINFRERFVMLRDSLYGVVIFTAFVGCTITFAFPFMRLESVESLIRVLYQEENLTGDWADPHPIYNLLVLSIAQWILVLLTCTLPIPTGIVTPSVMMGAGFGRLMGEAMRWMIGSHVHAPIYAVVGSVALTTGITRSLACSVIIFELTGQIHLLLPVLIATVLAMAVGHLFSDSFYDTIIGIRGLPTVRGMHTRTASKLHAKDIMIPRDQLSFVGLDDSLQDIDSLLRKGEQHLTYPLVRSRLNDFTLVGIVQRMELEIMVEKAREAELQKIEKAAQTSDDIERTDPHSPSPQSHADQRIRRRSSTIVSRIAHRFWPRSGPCWNCPENGIGNHG
eukprot:TRINITY_DN15097_c0_g1_i2.p1 TRINITY_DN15097_c0_g1~~TRINITY_DN15097_c0_g1_i2.p1  ORF type:complete len:666 (+),score=121.37 TRINITY_DN15097_c0_g1_i2:175-2172(+)